MKDDLYTQLIDDEREKQKYKYLLAQIEAQKEQAKKDKLTGYWMPLATVAPILAALVAAVGYIIGKLN